MKIDSITLGIFVFLVFTVPIVYIIIDSSRTSKKTKKQFNKLCTENGVTMSNYEVIGSAILAMDTSLKKVMYSKLNDLETMFQVVDLTAVKSCQVKTTQARKNYPELVELELIGPKFHNDIVVYQEDDDTTSTDPNMCLHEIQRWEDLIKKQLQ